MRELKVEPGAETRERRGTSRRSLPPGVTSLVWHALTVSMGTVALAWVAACGRDVNIPSPNGSLPTVTIAPSISPSQPASVTATHPLSPTLTATSSPTRAVPLLPSLSKGNYVVVSVRAPTCTDLMVGCVSLNAITPNGALIGPIASGNYSLSFSALSPAGNLIAYLDPPGYEGGSYSWVKLVDLATLVETRIDLPVQSAVAPVIWAPDGKRLLVSVGGNLELISINPAATSLALECESLWHEQGPECGPIAWSPNGKWVVFSVAIARSGPRDPRQGAYLLPASCFDSPETCRSHFTLLSGVWANASWSPDSRFLALGDYLHRLILFELSTGRFTTLATLAESIHSVSWSPDGSSIAVAAYPLIKVFSWKTGAVVDLRVPGIDEYVQIPFWLAVP